MMANVRAGYSTACVNEPGRPQVVVIDRDLTAPPGGEVDGDLYIPAATATGAWAGQEGTLAGWNGVDSSWKFLSPPNGFIVWIVDEMVSIICESSTWRRRDRLVALFTADQLLSPNNADWKVNALAPLSADSNNAALSCRLFDDTTEEGVGLLVDVPKGVKYVKIHARSRAETAPAGARTVGLKIYNRGIPGAVEAWSAGDVMADIDIPTDEDFQTDSEEFLISTLGITAGELTQIELTRVAPAAGTNLEGDLALLSLCLEFS